MREEEIEECLAHILGALAALDQAELEQCGLAAAAPLKDAVVRLPGDSGALRDSGLEVELPSGDVYLITAQKVSPDWPT